MNVQFYMNKVSPASVQLTGCNVPVTHNNVFRLFDFKIIFRLKYMPYLINNLCAKL
jgi:hypothetical protein